MSFTALTKLWAFKSILYGHWSGLPSLAAITELLLLEWKPRTTRILTKFNIKKVNTDTEQKTYRSWTDWKSYAVNCQLRWHAYGEQSRTVCALANDIGTPKKNERCPLRHIERVLKHIPQELVLLRTWSGRDSGGKKGKKETIAGIRS